MLDLLTSHDMPFYPVCCYGRSGSSLLMRLLAEFGVAVVPPLPFEDRSLQACFADWLGQCIPAAAGEPDDRAGRSFKIVKAFNAEYYARFGAEATTRPGFVANVAGYLATSKAAGKRGVAEKAIGQTLLRQMVALDNNALVRPIFLVRDPRDIFLSVKSFNERRGSRGFGDRGDDAQLLRLICHFVESQVALCDRLGSFLLHYEDLAQRRDRTLVELARYLRLPAIAHGKVQAVWAGVREGVDAASPHITSAGVADSIGRWLQPAAADYQVLFATEAARLNRLGYAA